MQFSQIDSEQLIGANNMKAINTQAIKDNLQHIAGNIVGMTLLKLTGTRYTAEQRNSKWFSTVAANNAADGFTVWFPFNILK